MAFSRIEIHFVVNGKKRRAQILPGSRVKAIRLGTQARTQPPPEQDVLIVADEPGDTVSRNDDGPGVCYEIGGQTFCW
jgi:hypothetical protein